jgi:hypothetical protein
MELDDPRWSELHGGYRLPYDPRKALLSIETGADVAAAWEELWENLHHQGDVDLASYAAVPLIARIHAKRRVADWNVYAIPVMIELERRNPRNPEMPNWLIEDYKKAWIELRNFALHDLRNETDEDFVLSAVAAIALAKEQRSLAEFAAKYNAKEQAEIMEKVRTIW